MSQKTKNCLSWAAFFIAVLSALAFVAQPVSATTTSCDYTNPSVRLSDHEEAIGVDCGSCSTEPIDYDVFISHKNFAAPFLESLATEIAKVGLRVYVDYSNGNDASLLVKSWASKTSRIAVCLLSPTYFGIGEEEGFVVPEAHTVVQRAMCQNITLVSIFHQITAASLKTFSVSDDLHSGDRYLAQYFSTVTDYVWGGKHDSRDNGVCDSDNAGVSDNDGAHIFASDDGAVAFIVDAIRAVPWVKDSERWLPRWKARSALQWFTGRVKEASLLQARLRDGLSLGPKVQRLFIAGGPGAGKTQLARRVVDMMLPALYFVWELDGSSVTALDTGLRSMSHKIEELRQLTMVRAEEAHDTLLGMRKHWLVLVDNLRVTFNELEYMLHAATVSSDAVSSSGIVLVTTRTIPLEYSAEWVAHRIAQFNSIDAVDLVYRYWATSANNLQINDRINVLSLVTSVDALPLALAQAASYIRQAGLSIQSYIAFLEQYPEAVISHNALRGIYEHGSLLDSVKTTLQEAQLDEKAVTLLDTLLVFHSSGISHELLLSASGMLPAEGMPSLNILDHHFFLQRTEKSGIHHVNMLRPLQMCLRILRPVNVSTLTYACELLLKAVNERSSTLQAVREQVNMLIHIKELATVALSVKNTPFPLIVDILRAQHRLLRLQIYTLEEVGNSIAQLQSILAAYEHDSSDSPHAALVRVDLAVAFLMTNEPQKAKEELEVALAIQESLYGPMHPVLAPTLSQLAAAYSALQMPAKALRLLKRGLDIQRQLKFLSNRSPELELAKTYASLAVAHRALGNSAQAKDSLDHARHLLEVRLCIDDVSRSNVFMMKIIFDNASSTYQSTNNVLQPMMSPSCEARFTATVEEELALAKTIGLIGRHYVSVGDASSALAFLNDSLGAYMKYYHNHSRAIARLMMDLGSAHLAMADASRARDYLERAVMLFKSAQGTTVADMTSTLLALSNAMYDLDDGAAAISALQEAINLARTESHQRDLAHLYWNLANVRFGLRDFIMALDDLEHAQNVTFEHFGPNHVEMAGILTTMARIHLRTNISKVEIALGQLERARLIGEQHYGKNSVFIVSTLQYLGSAYAFLGCSAMAVAYLERSDFILGNEHNLAHNAVHVAVLIGLGRAYVDLANSTMALKTLKRAIELAMFGQMQAREADAGAALIVTGKAYLTENSSVENAINALQNLKLGLSILERYFGKDDPLLCEALALLGIAQFRTGEVDRANEALETAYRIAMDNRDAKDIETFWNIVTLIQALATTGNRPKAHHVLDRLLELYRLGLPYLEQSALDMVVRSLKVHVNQNSYAGPSSSKTVLILNDDTHKFDDALVCSSGP